MDLCDTLALIPSWGYDCNGPLGQSSPKKDILADMSTIKDSFDSTATLFGNTTQQLFWLRGKSFTIDVKRLWSNNESANGTVIDGMRCVIGSGIGRVCSESDMPRIVQPKYGYLGVGFNTWYVNVRDGYWLRDLNWFGGAVNGGLDIEYYVSGTNNTSASDRPMQLEKISTKNILFPDAGDVAYKGMPVINAAEKVCTSSMLTDPTEPVRQNFFSTPSGKVATRCGSDMDEVIRALIPRPVGMTIDKVRP